MSVHSILGVHRQLTGVDARAHLRAFKGDGAPSVGPIYATRGFSGTRSRFAAVAGTCGGVGHRRAARLFGCAAVAAFALGVVPAAALAAQTRPLLASFGPDGTSSSSFSEIGQLAFSQGSARLYALDEGPSEIYGFDTSTPGTYSPLGGSFPLSVASAGGSPDIAVDNTAAPSSSEGDLYYVSESTQSVYGYDSSGAALGGNYPIAVSGSDICGAGVDPSGNVWVGDYANQEVREYDASGNPVTTVSTADQGTPCHVAFDAARDMYVAMYSGPVWEYTAASGYASATEIDPGSASAVTVDRATGDVYVAHSSEIDVYDASGNSIGSVGASVSGADWAGVAVDEATGDVYAADSGNNLIRVFGPETTMPDVTTGAATNDTTTSATVAGTVNPDGIALTDCHFNYGTTTSYGQTAPCSPAAAQIPADSSDHQVTAQLSNLTPGSVYHYQLVAANANGPNQGADQTFGTGAAIDSETVQTVSTDSATVSAQINPQGSPATYHVDYGTTTAYGNSTPESAPIGSDDTDHTVTVTLTGLTAGTTYHFRFVATESAGVTNGSDDTLATYGPPPTFGTCPNDQLRTGSYSAYLPDCRAYEQASPVDKNGGAAAGGLDQVQAASGGGAVTFGSMSPLPGASGAQDFPSIYDSSRATLNWSTQGLLPPESYGDHADVLGWTPDLGFAVNEAFHTGGGSSLLLDSLTDGSIQTIVPPTANAKFYFAGAAADGSEVFFEATGAQLTSDAASGRDNLYVWDRTTDALSLVGVLPSSGGGGAPTGGSFAGADNWWGGRLTDGGAEDRQYTQAEHVVSADGTRAYFTAGRTGQIYLRENPASPSATTVEVSASQRSTPDPQGEQPARFMAASADGSQALFTSPSELTDDANTGSADQGSDLYRFDASSGALTDLTPDPTDPNGADVQGVLGASDDGSYVYFAANGVLATGATRGDCQGQGNGLSRTGTCSLYVWHDGSASFIAKLDISGLDYTSDATNWQPTAKDAAVPHEGTARVTPDGETILFRSQRQLTGYDNQVQCGNLSGSQCPEFYRYSVSTGQLDCVSCVPTGATPSGPPTLQSINTFGGYSGAGVLTRNLSSSGDQVFFESPDPLVAADTNGAQDVYEWEADGAGSCQSDSQNGGCLYLLSTGRDGSASYFADASASGNDAFIFTDQQLVGQDGDDAYDVYDARVDGGLASQTPASPSSCSGDTCKPPAASAPSPPTVATVTFSGPGNGTTSPKPRAGKVRVLHKAVRGQALLLKVRVPGAGRIVASGAQVRSASRRVRKAGTYKLTVRLSARAKRTLRRKHPVRVSMRVRYARAGGGFSSAAVSVMVSR